MIKVEGKDLWRGGVKIGYVENGHIIDHSGEKIGFYRDNHVFDRNENKIAYIEDDFIHFSDSTQKIRIEDNNEDVVGGDLTNLEKAAVRILLGE